MTRSRADLLAAVLLPLLAFLPYVPALDGEFVIDDVRFIVDNEANLTHPNGPWIYFTDPSTNADVPDGDIYRPLRTWSFAVDHALSSGPFGFHLHNTLLHVLVVLLLWRLLRPHRPDGDPSVPLFGCALFAVHPLASEAVAWISSRADLHAAVLVLSALLVARAAESRPRLLPLVALLGFLCGFGKETAVVVPALAVVERRWRRGSFSGGWAPTVALAAGVLAYLAVYLSVTGRDLTGQVGLYGGSYRSHLPYALAGLGTHLRLFVWPFGQNPLWETNLFVPLATWRVALSIAGLGALLSVAVRMRRTLPAVTAGITWWAIALFPAANLVFPLRTVLAERFAYLPLVGLSLAAAAGLHALSSRAGLRRFAGLLAGVLITALALRTAVRADDWSSAERLYRATLASFPDSYAPHYGLGGIRLAEGETALRSGDVAAATPLLNEAIEQFVAATVAAGDDVTRGIDARFGHGRALVLQGAFVAAVDVLAEVDRRWTANAELAASSRHAAEARFQLGLAQSRVPRLADAEETFRRLIEIHGETPRRLDAYGEVLRARLDGRAVEQFDRALQLDPDHHPARIHLAEVLRLHTGYQGMARQQLKEVLARDPSNARAAALLEAWRLEDEE